MKWVKEDWQPSATDLQWCRQMVRTLRHGSHWGTTCGELYEIDHMRKQLRHVFGPKAETHERNVIAFGKIGYDVV